MTGFLLAWNEREGSISLKLPDGKRVLVKDGAILTDLTQSSQKAATVRDADECEIFDAVNFLSSKSEEVDDGCVESVSEAKLSESPPESTDLQTEGSEELPSEEVQTQLESGNENTEQVIFNSPPPQVLDGWLVCDLVSGKCVRCAEGDVHFYCADRVGQEKSAEICDPHCAAPKVLLVFPSGHRYEVLSYKEGRTALLEQTETKDTSTADCQGLYMNDILLPTGSKKHITIREYTPSESEEASVCALPEPCKELYDLAIPCLRRPSIPELDPSQIGTPFVIPEPPLQKKLPLNVFREIVEFVPDRQSSFSEQHQACSQQFKVFLSIIFQCRINTFGRDVSGMSLLGASTWKRCCKPGKKR